MADSRKQIVIIGGGAGGIMAANRLRKELRPEEADITLIERNLHHFYQPGYLTLLFDIDQPEKLVRNVKDLLRDDIKLHVDEAKRIDFKRKSVLLGCEEVHYDYLVIATGAKLYLDEPDGLKEGLAEGKNVFTFYSMEHAVKLREALKRFNGGTIVSCICEMPIKCLAAPVEFILLAEAQMRKRGIRDKCRFILTVPSPSIPPNVEPYASHIESMLSAKGIEVRTEFTPSKVEGAKGVCHDFLGDGVEFDLLCIIPPHMGEDVIQETEGLGDPMGWAMTDKNTLEHKNARSVFVIGDAGNFPSGKTASAARKQAAVLAQRLRAIIRREQPATEYDGNTICPILTGFGKALFAEFDYAKSISSYKDSFAKWFLHVYLLRWLYWDFILKARFFR
jgi:sulfide:quinone oxidoreductase